MTGFVQGELERLALTFFDREDWVSRFNRPAQRDGLPAVYGSASQYMSVFSPFLARLRWEYQYTPGKGQVPGVFVRPEPNSYYAVGPLMRDVEELREWARQEYPDRVVVTTDPVEDIASVMLQAFAMPHWRQQHPDIAAEVDNLRVLLELGA